MPQNIKFNPVKKDYEVVAGSPVSTDRIYERGYFALAIPRNNWIYGGPEVGSDLYLMRGEKRTPNTDVLYAARAKAAIESQVVLPGDAVQSDVQNIEGTRSGTSNNVEIQPAELSDNARLSYIPV